MPRFGTGGVLPGTAGARHPIKMVLPVMKFDVKTSAPRSMESKPTPPPDSAASITFGKIRLLASAIYRDRLPDKVYVPTPIHNVLISTVIRIGNFGSGLFITDLHC